MIIAGRVRISAILVLLAFSLLKAQSPVTLKQALQQARANNPDLKIQTFNIGIAEADVVTAKLRPNLTLNNQSLQLMDHRYYPAGAPWTNGKNRQIWWQLTKTFQLPAQRHYKVDYAQKSLELSQKSFQEDERNTLLAVATKWVDVWTARKQLDILIQAKANIDSLASINRLRLKNQVISQTDLARTELLANQYALQIKTAEQAYKSELTSMKFLLGTQQDIGIDTTDSFSDAFAGSPDSLINEALVNRGDVQSLQTSIDLAKSNIKLQKAMAFPQPELGLIYNPQNTIPYFGFYGTIEIPLFSRNQGEIRKSNLLKLQAEQGLSSARQLVQAEITRAFYSYQTEKQNLSNFETVLRQSQDILNNVRYAYLRGGTTIIDYLEAQRSWLDTKQQYYQTTQRYRQSYVELLYATGLINKLAN